jgi:cell division protein ZapA
LKAAAEILGADAKALVAQSSKLSESQMLLISGLMTADRAISLQEKINTVEAEISQLKLTLENASGKAVDKTTIKNELVTQLTKLSVQAETLADNLEAK